MHHARMKRLVRGALVLCAITFALGELVARMLRRSSDNGMPMIGRWVLRPYRPELAVVLDWWAKTASGTYMVEDPELGWSLRPSGRPDLCQADAQGLRADPARVYTDERPARKLRILALGDSFTHGDDVKNDEAWTHVLEELRPEFETLNLGVPA